MAPRNRFTNVSVHFAPWHEDARTGYAEKPIEQRVHGRLKELKTVTLASGGLLLGRSTADSPVTGWQRYDFALSDDLVSRVGFEIREDQINGYTHVHVKQECIRQKWGQSGASKLDRFELPVVDTVRLQPTSYRIDGQTGSYWILIEPGIRSENEQSNGTQSTSGAKETATAQRLKAGSELHVEFLELLPVLEVYFGQYLEWPPRVSPARDRNLKVVNANGESLPSVENSDIAALKLFDGKLSHLFGYTKWDQAGAPAEMIAWLTSPGGNMPFNVHQQPSRIGLSKKH